MLFLYKKRTYFPFFVFICDSSDSKTYIYIFFQLLKKTAKQVLETKSTESQIVDTTSLVHHTVEKYGKIPKTIGNGISMLQELPEAAKRFVF